MTCRIDHITVTSPRLDAGSDWVFEHLSVRPQRGGEHPRMGTHNLLLRLGETMFLEVIAVNPAAVKPPRPRWFGLDTLVTDAEPRLACWVARTDDIQKLLCSTPERLGVVEPMSRGSLEWLISIPENGSLPLGGVAPTLIEWHTAAHPASAMQAQGCQLVALELLHPEPQRIGELLHAFALSEPGVNVSVRGNVTPTVVAYISTPQGLRTIGGT